MRRCLAQAHTLAAQQSSTPLLALQSVATSSCTPSTSSSTCSSHSSSRDMSSSAGQHRQCCGEAGPSSTHFSLLPHLLLHRHRSHSSSISSSFSSRRAFSSTPAPGEEQDVDKIGNEKVQRLAAEVLGLTVLESSQLSTILRKKLDIPRPAAFGGAMPAFAAGPGMAAAGGPGQPSGQQQAEAAAAPEAPKAKTEFDVKLDSFTADGKIKVIKEIRALTNLGLKEAKELVDKAPVVLKSGVPTEDAENWKKVIETAGGKVELT